MTFFCPVICDSIWIEASSPYRQQVWECWPLPVGGVCCLFKAAVTKQNDGCVTNNPSPSPVWPYCSMEAPLHFRTELVAGLSGLIYAWHPAVCFLGCPGIEATAKRVPAPVQLKKGVALSKNSKHHSYGGRVFLNPRSSPSVGVLETSSFRFVGSFSPCSWMTSPLSSPSPHICFCLCVTAFDIVTVLIEVCFAMPGTALISQPWQNL